MVSFLSMLLMACIVIALIHIGSISAHSISLLRGENVNDNDFNDIKNKMDEEDIESTSTSGCDSDPSYDYYLLVLQWPYSFSSSHLIDHFTIHGLWPSRSEDESSYPCYCDGKSEDESDFDVNDIRPDDLKKMKEYWPSLFSSKNAEFWKHEWTKHGTCSNGISLPDYFHLTLQLRDKFDPLAALGDFISYGDDIVLKRHEDIVNALYDQYGVGVSLGCKHQPQSEHQYLSEIAFCLSKNDPHVKYEGGCPDDLLRDKNSEVSNCKENEKIVIPYANSIASSKY